MAEPQRELGGGLVPPNPKSRQKLSKKNSIKLDGCTSKSPTSFGSGTANVRQLRHLEAAVRLWILKFHKLVDIGNRQHPDIGYDSYYGDLMIF